MQARKLEGWKTTTGVFEFFVFYTTLSEKVDCFENVCAQSEMD
jgi:hypothetical protein